MHSHIHKYILMQPAQPIQCYTYVYVLRDDHLLLDNGLWANLWGRLILSHQPLVAGGSSSRVGLCEVLSIHIGVSAAFALFMSHLDNYIVKFLWVHMSWSSDLQVSTSFSMMFLSLRYCMYISWVWSQTCNDPPASAFQQLGQQAWSITQVALYMWGTSPKLPLWVQPTLNTTYAIFLDW